MNHNVRITVQDNFLNTADISPNKLPNQYKGTNTVVIGSNTVIVKTKLPNITKVVENISM